MTTSHPDTPTSPELLARLRERGVRILAPHTVVIGDDVDPRRCEPGATLYPGCVVRGARTLLGRDCELGRAGGGCFDNVVVGRGAQLYGGVYEDTVLLDGVIVRGHAEMRGGTLMEERSEAAHHVGYKMTITLPCVVAGSLINFCDALVAGGTSRSDHSEIGSTLALYNFTPWGDKFASLFGDVPSGVFMRSPRIFIGGQTQVVSPVKVGYGALIPAGCAVRRSVPAGRMVGEAGVSFDTTFDPRRYGGLIPKLELTAEFIGNLHALLAFYQHARLPFARRTGDDPLLVTCYEEAMAQVRAGIAERIKRLGKLVDKLPRSLELHEQAVAEGTSKSIRRIDEHRRVIEGWASLQRHLESPPALDASAASALDAVGAALAAAPADNDWLTALASLDDELVEQGRQALQRVVDATTDHALCRRA